MNSLSRLIGYSVLLLVVFLGAALAAQGWLHRQTRDLRAEAIDAKRAQLKAVFGMMPKPVRQWEDSDRRQAGAMIGGTVTVLVAAMPAASPDASSLYFDERAGDPPLDIRVSFPAPSVTRWAALYQRVVVGLALLAAVLLGLWFMLVAFAWSRPAHEAASRSPWAAAQAEMNGLTQLARTSVAQGEELGRERDVRRRAEEDAQLRQRRLYRPDRAHPAGRFSRGLTRPIRVAVAGDQCLPDLRDRAYDPR